MQCREGEDNSGTTLPVTSRAVHFPQGFVSQLLSCFTFVCVWGGFSVN